MHTRAHTHTCTHRLRAYATTTTTDDQSCEEGARRHAPHRFAHASCVACLCLCVDEWACVHVERLYEQSRCNCLFTRVWLLAPQTRIIGLEGCDRRLSRCITCSCRVVHTTVVVQLTTEWRLSPNACMSVRILPLSELAIFMTLWGCELPKCGKIGIREILQREFLSLQQAKYELICLNIHTSQQSKQTT